jgi:hypothetical protein
MLFNSYPFGVPMGGGGPDAAKVREVLTRRGREGNGESLRSGADNEVA